MILVISYPEEEHTGEVVGYLRQSGVEVGLMNLSDFPTRAAVELTWQPEGVPVYLVDGPDGRMDLSEVRAAWWRRVVPFEIDAKVGRPIDRAFSESETSQAVNGMLDALDCSWVNPRSADEAAHRKPLQWDVARRVGLELPKTLVTNNPGAAKRFIDDVGVGKTVFKAFLATTEEWRETRLVEPEDVARLDSVRYAPVIFQEYVEGVDLRIIAVGDRLFTAEIDARKTAYPVDMRMSLGESVVRPVELPSDVHDTLLRLMGELGLVYGAIDMRRTDGGKHIFLEVNPAGQWLFVEERTGQPISRAVADLLIELHDARG